MSANTREPSLASILVARFLRTNNYTQTLRAFIREAGLPADAGHIGLKKDDDSSSWTIEGVVEEKRVFDQSVKAERYGDAEKDNDLWSTPAPSAPTVVQVPTSSNVLACSVDTWKYKESETALSSPSYIVATGADRQLHLIDTAPGNSIVKSFTGHSESPILSYVSIQNGDYALLTNMSGQVLLQRGTEILDRRRDHTKYVVKVVAFEEENDSNDPDSPGKTIWIATAAWDSKVFLYRLRIGSSAGESQRLVLGEPVGYITLPSNPESMLFVRHTDTQDLILLVARRDSTHLFYYQVQRPSSSSPAPDSDAPPYECRLLGKQNLAPHSNAWVAFSPSCLALSPTDPGLLAVATSTLPHMKVIVVRLLFPSVDSLDPVTSGPVTGSSEPEPTTSTRTIQATRAFAALTLQNREDAAIMIQANTFAPQTAYSTPQVAWRPDGSGVWVNGDDGVIRGVETKTGKVVAILKDGHEIGVKVRAIWAGWVDVSRNGELVREEWLVSGGFDKRLVVWKKES